VLNVSLPAQLIRTRRFALGVPGQFSVTADGDSVLYLRGRAGDDPTACLWALDPDSGKERLLADPAELAGNGQPRTAGIGGYATDTRGRMVAFALAGGLWTVDVTGGKARRLPARAPVRDPRPDPAGQRIAYVSGGALRVIGADGTGDRDVAAPDGTHIGFGVGVHTDTTSTDGPRGFWWAPDGRRLLVARVDSAGVGLWHLADPAEPGRPPRTVRYAAAGTPVPEVTLWIAPVDCSRARAEARWDRAAFPYPVGAGWDGHGPYAVVQSRDQRTVRLLGIDPDEGGTRVLGEQRDTCWVALVPGLPVRTGSGALVGHADLRGTRHLTVDGVAVTPPGLQVRAVLAVDGEEALFTASRAATQTHLWRWDARRGLRRLTAGPVVHSGVRRGGVLVTVAQSAAGPAGRAEVRRDGRAPVTVPSVAERPVLGVRMTPLALGPDRLRAALHLPSWHRIDGPRLPVLLDPYGGTGRQRVTAACDWRSLVAQWFAEQGFAVLVADGRGTPGRGPDWERAVHGDLYGPALEDQVTALHEAARLCPALDLGRVGIRGWSYGGSLAAWAVLHRPDVFHAAVAGASVTDQRLYDAHWRERVLGHPAAHPERYEASSLVNAAPRLTRPLLLVHGLADTTAHPAHSLRLSQALLAAGRPHEVLLLPGVGHAAIGAPGTEGLLEHQLAFLQRHLAAAPPSGT
jgi:dipeptidyl-peptidase-4